MKAKSKKKVVKKPSIGELLFDIMIERQPELLSNILKDNNFFVYQDKNLNIVRKNPDRSLTVVKKYGGR
jgi:hypothetical protein